MRSRFSALTTLVFLVLWGISVGMITMGIAQDINTLCRPV
ncbi:hypothetical protein SYYSPA8_33760 [Streptomyces yaizuensis]|uniref:Uncharacterized protein n=1 Tax=Streptomyces yaizuensis TaxID=2989713 RepID=A0ABQ5P9Z2_9ACTN|nr:hypothetical protein SYYSPA8_33760 [Streptomyces sp. YSPA8]